MKRRLAAAAAITTAIGLATAALAQTPAGSVVITIDGQREIIPPPGADPGPATPRPTPASEAGLARRPAAIDLLPSRPAGGAPAPYWQDLWYFDDTKEAASLLDVNSLRKDGNIASIMHLWVFKAGARGLSHELRRFDFDCSAPRYRAASGMAYPLGRAPVPKYFSETWSDIAPGAEFEKERRFACGDERVWKASAEHIARADLNAQLASIRALNRPPRIQP